MYGDLNELVGLTILSVDMTGDRKALRFNVEGREPLVYYADGDCCSSSWIEHIEGVARLKGKVTATEDIDLPGVDADNEWDVVTVYGYGITTDNGTAVIDFRNASNGYYGGSMVLVSGCVAPEAKHYHYFYGGVYGQNRPEDGWKPLTEDL